MAGPVIPLIVVASKVVGKQIVKILSKRVGKTNVGGVSTIAGAVGGAGVQLEKGRRHRKLKRKTKKKKVVRRQR